MKILVTGAVGKTGKDVVEQAVAASPEVTAFVRKADDYNEPNVCIIEGDATNRSDMDTAVRGRDAVLDTIGGKTPHKATMLESSAAGTVIASMQQNGIRRLVVTSMLGEGDSETNGPFYERLLVSTFLRGADKDKAAMESAVKPSGLDWVILRPAILSDGPATGNVRVLSAETDEKAHKITRADMAAFMLARLSNNEYLYQAVTIANG